MSALPDEKRMRILLILQREPQMYEPLRNIVYLKHAAQYSKNSAKAMEQLLEYEKQLVQHFFYDPN